MDTKHIVDPGRGGRRKGAGRPKGTGKYGEATVPVRIPVSLKPEFDVWILDAIKTAEKIRSFNQFMHNVLKSNREEKDE